MVVNTSFPNVTITHYFATFNFISTEKLISCAYKVISTLSTVLMDCELYKKYVILYKCESNKLKVNQLESIQSFESFNDLELFINEKELARYVINSGYLYSYDNPAFLKMVKRYYRTTRCKDLIPMLINNYSLLAH